LVPSGTELLFSDESDIPNFEELLKLSKENNVKLFIAVGGLGNEEQMSSVAPGDLVAAAKAFASKYAIDGFELDPGAASAGSAGKIAALAKALMDAGFSVALALPGDEALASAVPAETASKLDALSLWFTDQMSAKESALKPNSNTVANIKTLAAFANAGIPKEKIMAIVPFYGRSFEGAKSMGSSFAGVGSGNEGALQYRELMEKFADEKLYKVAFDEASQSEIAIGESEAIVFNGIPSMQAIAKAVKDNGYGGIAAFDISGDHKEPIISLLVSIGQILRPDVNYKKKR
jgi:GH18 family chitinase